MIDRLIKERYYILYTTKDNNTFIKNTIEMFIKKVFRLYELSASIMFNRDSQFIVTIEKSFCKRLDI